MVRETKIVKKILMELRTRKWIHDNLLLKQASYAGNSFNSIMSWVWFFLFFLISWGILKNNYVTYEHEFVLPWKCCYARKIMVADVNEIKARLNIFKAIYFLFSQWNNVKSFIHMQPLVTERLLVQLWLRSVDSSDRHLNWRFSSAFTTTMVH